MADYSIYPAINAALNGTTAALIVTGRVLIGRGRLMAHRACMIAAVICSAGFLGSYVWYHAHVGSVRFQGQGAVRPVYFAILISHTLLAAVVVPLVIVTLTRGLRARFDRHRAIARWTYPIWLYVSITGVVIYMMLYHIYAAPTIAAGF
jgi:putative membrane protein